MLDLGQTESYYINWCHEQGIQPAQLLLELYSSLRMCNPKKNTLYLQGRSNAGNTYLLTGIVPFKETAGSHITSKDFPFMECVTKSIILINELTLANQQEEETSFVNQ